MIFSHEIVETQTQRSLHTGIYKSKPIFVGALSPKKNDKNNHKKQHKTHNKMLFPVFMESSLLRNNSRLFTIPFDSPTKPPRRERRLRGGFRWGRHDSSSGSGERKGAIWVSKIPSFGANPQVSRHNLVQL